MAAKGYFDALVKLGELASDSQGSKELGEENRGCGEHLKKTAANKVKRANVTAGEELQIVCRMCRRGMEMKTRGMRKCREREQRGKGESGVIVGRLTTPHDLIVMLKTAGEAGRRVGGQDASQHILQRCVAKGGREGGTHGWMTLCGSKLC